VSSANETTEETTVQQPDAVSEETQKAAVDRIAKELGEHARQPLKQLRAIVKHCGVEFADRMVAEAKEIEANGGMMIRDGSRRRTLGGVFFFVAKDRMTDEQRNTIFVPTWRKNRFTPPKHLPSFDFDQRADIRAEIIQNPGEAKEVYIKLVGRPGDLKKYQEVVMTTVEHELPLPSVPRGVPEIPPEKTTFTVYIGLEQWSKVEKQLSDPDRLMQVEGLCVYDEAMPGITVYATSIRVRKRKGKGGEDGTEQNGKSPKAKQDKKAKPDKKQPAAAKGAAKKPSTPRTAPTSQPAPVEPPVFDMPENAPPDVQKKLTELHTAAAQFREKINAAKAKPEGQRFGLEMTQRLLDNVERQIKQLEAKYS
jgi:hypothetical protein